MTERPPWPRPSRKWPPAPAVPSSSPIAPRPSSAWATRTPGSSSSARPRGPTKTARASRSWAAPGNCSTRSSRPALSSEKTSTSCNILKCRPPGNRNPLPVEAAACREYLDRQLAIIQPEFICCLGAVAAQNLLDTTVSIGRLRGRFHDYHGIQVLCTYHPAYLLRNPSAKRHVWEDMQLLMAEMGIELPER